MPPLQSSSYWRGRLGIDQKTLSALQLRQKRLTGHLNAVRHLIDYCDSERGRKIADARTGKPRPRHVIEAMHNAVNEQLWTVEEDHAVRTLSSKLAAHRTGRTLSAVNARRRRLRLPDGRKRK